MHGLPQCPGTYFPSITRPGRICIVCGESLLCSLKGIGRDASLEKALPSLYTQGIMMPLGDRSSRHPTLLSILDRGNTCENRHSKLWGYDPHGQSSIFLKPILDECTIWNPARGHVDRDFFVSIEQDVLLAYDWWTGIPEYVKNPLWHALRASESIWSQLCVFLKNGSLTSSKEQVVVKHDNNIFRTKVIRFLGGFPQSCPVCTDTILIKRILSETRLQMDSWSDVISLHMRLIWK